MHVSMYLAYQPVQTELSIFGKTINFSLEDRQHNERLSLTMSLSQVEALTEGLQAALRAATEKKQYADITVKRLWDNTGDGKAELTVSPAALAQHSEPISEVPADQAA